MRNAECGMNAGRPEKAFAFIIHHSALLFGAVVQLVRIPACHAGGRGFESRPLRHRVEKGEPGSPFSLRAPEADRVIHNRTHDTAMELRCLFAANIGMVTTAMSSHQLLG